MFHVKHRVGESECSENSEYSENSENSEFSDYSESSENSESSESPDSSLYCHQCGQFDTLKDIAAVESFVGDLNDEVHIHLLGVEVLH